MDTIVVSINCVCVCNYRITPSTTAATHIDNECADMFKWANSNVFHS